MAIISQDVQPANQNLTRHPEGLRVAPSWSSGKWRGK
jgi:hypothetical protein